MRISRLRKAARAHRHIGIRLTIFTPDRGAPVILSLPAVYCEETGDKAQWSVPRDSLPPGMEMLVEPDLFPASDGYWLDPRSHGRRT